MPWKFLVNEKTFLGQKNAMFSLSSSKCIQLEVSNIVFFPFYFYQVWRWSFYENENISIKKFDWDRKIWSVKLVETRNFFTSNWFFLENAWKYGRIFYDWNYLIFEHKFSGAYLCLVLDWVLRSGCVIKKFLFDFFVLIFIIPCQVFP